MKADLTQVTAARLTAMIGSARDEEVRAEMKRRGGFDATGMPLVCQTGTPWWEA
jgi:hypothetical protein